MSVRVPVLHCMPTMGSRCYTTTKNITAAEIAEHYNVWIGDLDVIMNHVPRYYSPELEGFAASRLCEDIPGKSYCYKLFADDDLFDLAPRFGIPTWQALCKYNNLADCDRLNQSYAISIPVHP